VGFGWHDSVAERFEVLRFIAVFSALFVMASFAQAKSARCFTTDDGSYKCDFKRTRKDGSFEIKAKGKPSFNVIMEKPGFASVYINIGGRGIPINGMYVRQSDDGACWSNSEQNTKLCVW
jgi:hypothetical protein